MALVGLLESLLTAKLVDDITDTHSDKTREAWGQGAANVITGFFGGMGGCAMIGQTMINVKASGARTRISTFLAGVFLLILVVGFGDVVAVIPMAALVAVMIMVVGRHLRLAQHPARDPAPDAEVRDHRHARHRRRHRRHPQPRHRRRRRRPGRDDALRPPGRPPHRDPPRARRATPTAPPPRSTPSPASCSSPPATTSTPSSSTPHDPDRVVIDLTASHVWDASTVASLDAITTKYQRKGKTVEIVGLDRASADRHERLTGRLAAH